PISCGLPCDNGDSGDSGACKPRWWHPIVTTVSIVTGGPTTPRPPKTLQPGEFRNRMIADLQNYVRKHLEKPLAERNQDAVHGILRGLGRAVVEMDRKWGAGRLELLVSDEQRQRFRRQQRKLDLAIVEGDPVVVEQRAAAMTRGYAALDAEATALGHHPISGDLWETKLGDGTTILLARNDAEALVVADKHHEVWTLHEIAKLIESTPGARVAKRVFPGATVTDVRAK